MVAKVAEKQQAKGTAPRPAMNVPRNVLDAFERLVALQERQRTAAGMVILQHVDHILKNALAEHSEFPAGVKYIVKRLVSGLASTRICAREGFFSTLCLLLRRHPSFFKPAFILSLLTNKKSATIKSAVKSEIREQMMAELLLCGAIVRSGQVKRSREVMQCVVNQLCAIRTNTKYMEMIATQFLVNLMEQCEGSSIHMVVWQSLKAELQSAVADLSPSQLWLRLVLLRIHSENPPVWLTSTLTPNNHIALRETIMKAVDSLPNVHPVVPELVSTMAAASSSSSSSSLLVVFWTVVMEPLQSHSSPGTLQIIFHFLKFIISHLKTVAEVKAVLTPAVMGLLLRSLSQPQHDLKEAARGVTSALVQFVADNKDEKSELQLAVVKALVTRPGSIRFDQLAGHKVLQLMIPSFTFTTLKDVTVILIEVLKKPNVAKDLMVVERNYAAHVLVSLLGQPNACTEEAAQWKQQQLAVLLELSFFTPKKEENEGNTMKQAFLKALDQVVGRIKEYSVILMSLVQEVQRKLRAAEEDDTAGGPSQVVPLNEKEKEQWSRVYSRLSILNKKKYKEDSPEYIAKTIFQVLFCQMALHLFVDATVAVENLNEFVACHKEVKKLGILSDDNEENKDDDEEDEEESYKEGPNWVELTTELLLGLMTQEIHLFRHVGQGLFRMMSPLMTRLALTLITDVLDTKKARKLLKKAGEEENENEEESEDEDEDDNSDDLDEESDDNDNTDSVEEEEEEGNENLFTLKKEMLNAAGDIDVDVDMDSVPQEELDGMNDKLGALITQYLGKNPGKKKKRKGKVVCSATDGPQLTPDEESCMHFQTRVCDMLIGYIKAAHSLALQVWLVMPILKAVHMAQLDPRLKDLQSKLSSVVKTLATKKKFKAIGDITADSWRKTADEFFSCACKMPKTFMSVIQSCYCPLMNCGRLLLKQTEEAVMEPDNFFTAAYSSHLKSFFTKENSFPYVQPFTEPCTYNVGGQWHVADVLVQATFDSNISIFKRSQALNTLQQLYTNKIVVAERSRAEMISVEQKLYKSLVKTLESMESSVKITYTTSLFSFLVTFLKVDRGTESGPHHDWEAMRVCLEAFRSRISKSYLSSFRGMYNSLKNMLSSKGQKKQKGKKRVAEMNKGDSQKGQAKKRKTEDIPDATNSINAPESSLDGTMKRKNKKKKKDKQGPSKGETVKSKNIEVASKKTVLEIKDENSDDEVMVVNGNGDSDVECLGEMNTEEKTKKKKKKLAGTSTINEEDTETPEQEETTEKKKKSKLTVEKSEKKSKKNKKKSSC